MTGEKITIDHIYKVTYDKNHWDLLALYRERTEKIMRMFYKEGLKPLVFGSLARGDINENSDIDIIFPHKIPTYKLEVIINNNGEQIYAKEIIQATPGDTIKANIYLSKQECLTVPLIKFIKKSFQLYQFGGSLDLSQLLNNERVPGIDKNLIITIPSNKGHNELALKNNELYASKLLNIDIDFIYQRKRVLTRRDKIGRTGVFLHENLNIEDNFEKILKDISDRNSFVRKILMNNRG